MIDSSEEETNPVADLFLRSAARLADARRDRSGGDDVGALIEALGYSRSDRASALHEAALLRAAAKFVRIFQLKAPQAPGLVCFGCEADPARIGWKAGIRAVGGLSGTGLSTCEAFESCVGEAVEYLSQFASGTDFLLRLLPADYASPASPRAKVFISALMRHVGIASGQELDWLTTRRLSDGAGVDLPADMCLRRAPDARDFVAPFKLSIGCGAGTSLDSASLHGLFELIERDAVSLWWRGGRRGRPISPESEAARLTAELLARLRQGGTERRTWFLDIATDIGVPCVVALSCGANGRGLACGFAARATLAAALRSATMEMCQMELALAVVEAKRRERGEAAFNEADLVHIRRATLIDAGTCTLLHPLGAAAAAAPESDRQEPASALRMLVDKLMGMGIETYAIDLTRPVFGIPVVRIVAPPLQLEPSEIIGDRLAAAIAETGGGRQYTGGVPLL
jgi:ribosomal protein S12 methylthiotransferase accessory factor